MHTASLKDTDAQSRENLKGLAIHAAAYVVVCSWLVVINLLTTPEFAWFTWTLFGWGMGLSMHTVGVLQYETLTEPKKRAWIERQPSYRPAATAPTLTPCRCAEHVKRET